MVLDEAAARRCAAAGCPAASACSAGRLGRSGPADLSGCAIALVRNTFVHCPRRRTNWCERADAADRRRARPTRRRGEVVAVIGGRGGAGASLFAAALAQARHRGAAGRPRSVGRRHRPAAGRRGVSRAALARPGAAGRSAELGGGARRAAAAPRDQRAVGHAARSRDRPPARSTPSSMPAAAAAPPWCAICRGASPTPPTGALDAADLVVVVTQCDVRACAADRGDGSGAARDQSQRRPRRARAVARRAAGRRGRRDRRAAAAGGNASRAAAGREAGTRRSAVAAAVPAGRGRPPGARGAAGGPVSAARAGAAA